MYRRQHSSPEDRSLAARAHHAKTYFWMYAGLFALSSICWFLVSVSDVLIFPDIFRRLVDFLQVLNSSLSTGYVLLASLLLLVYLAEIGIRALVLSKVIRISALEFSRVELYCRM